MAALLMEIAGGPNRIDRQARSREFLRRGLLLSGAIHLTLLYAFLHLPGGGEDVLVRSYDRATEIFHEPVVPRLLPLPPAAPGSAATAADGPGEIVPVDRVDLPKIHFEGIGPVDFAAQPGSGEPASAPRPGDAVAPTLADPDRVYTIATVETPPVPLDAPKPAYPEYAREVGITGRVVTQVLVRADGSVARVVVRSGIKILGDAAQETLYRWRFRPARVGGRPVAVWVEIPVLFRL